MTTEERIGQSQFRLPVVDSWNSLPDYVVEASSMKSFKGRLDIFWADQPIRFDHDSHITTTSSCDKIKIITEDSDLDIEAM